MNGWNIFLLISTDLWWPHPPSGSGPVQTCTCWPDRPRTLQGSRRPSTVRSVRQQLLVIVISDAAISFMHSWKLARKRTTKMSKISKHWIKVLKVLFQIDSRRRVSLQLTRRSQRRSWRCVRCSGGQSWQGLGHSQTTRMQRHLLPQSHLKSVY